MKNNFDIIRRLRSKDNNKGVSIVTVIVAIGFVAILASVIMMTSIVNFKMKSVNVYAKDSFYSAEQVLDEINVGLQQVVSDGLSHAYTEVLTKYNSEDLSASDKNNMVKAEYYEYIWKQLGVTDASGEPVPYKDASGRTIYKYLVQETETGNPADGTDSTAGLYGMLKASTKWHPDADIDKTYGAFLRGTETDGANYLGLIRTYDNDGVVLKDLTVYYKDSNGFISAIKTDIRLGYPEFVFSSTDIPDVADYAFITDTAYIQKNTGVSKSSAVKTEITGNTYAYAMDVVGANIENKAVESDVDMHIVATDLGVTNGGFTTNANSVLWARDIESKSSNVTLAGQSYVYDDLDIKGRDSVITLKGYYTGFGNSTTNSGESSAILINGVNTTVDLSNIRKLSLAGRAYIGTSDSSNRVGRIARNDDGTEDDSDEARSKLSDVFTGESIAVKSNQLMYLVPGDCIGVALDENGKPGSSMYGKNPLTLSEYNNIMGNVKDAAGYGYVEVAGNKPIKKLVGNTDNISEELLSSYNLGNYVETDASGNPKVEKVFMRAANGTDRLVYYYMTFSSEDKASEYFAKYYNTNKASVDKYLSKYLSALTLPLGEEVQVSLKLDMAAPAITGNKTDGYNISSYLRVPEGGNTISEDFEVSKVTYTEQYQAYCSKLKSDYADIADGSNSDILRTGFPKYDPATGKMKIAEADASDAVTDGGVKHSDNYYTVFKNIVDEEVLKDMVGGSSGSVELADKGSGKVLLIYDTNVDTVKTVSTDYRLIIANCGVELTGNNFEGLIIAKGVIKTPSGNMTIKAMPDEVGNCLLYETDDEVYKVADVFGSATDTTYTTAIKGSGETVTSASLVIYENWTKNVNIN